MAGQSHLILPSSATTSTPTPTSTSGCSSPTLDNLSATMGDSYRTLPSSSSLTSCAHRRSTDYRMQLNNYLQANGGSRILTWEVYQTGPLHQPMWTAVALSERFIASRRVFLVNHHAQSAVSNTAVPMALVNLPSRKRLHDKHWELSCPTAALAATHERAAQGDEANQFPSVCLLSLLSSLLLPHIPRSSFSTLHQPSRSPLSPVFPAWTLSCDTLSIRYPCPFPSNCYHQTLGFLMLYASDFLPTRTLS